MENYLKNIIDEFKHAFSFVVLFSLISNVLMLASPIYMLQIYDRVLASRSVDTLILLSLIVFIALAVMGILENIRLRILIKVGGWLDKTLAGNLFEIGLKTNIEAGKEPSTLLMKHLNSVKNFIGGPPCIPLLDAPWIPIFLLFIFMLHPTLGYIATFGGLALFLIALLNDLLSKKVQQQANGLNASAMAEAESVVRNSDAILSMGILNNFLKKWQVDKNLACDVQIKAASIRSIFSSLSKTLRLLLQSAILGVGAWLVIQNEITSGVMIAASILMSRALAPVEQSISSWGAAVSAKQGYQEIKAVYLVRSKQEPSTPLPKPKGHFQVENLTYYAADSKNPVLKNIHFELLPGEALGVVGPSGSGKSTLAKLLLGTLKPQIGYVRLDNMDVSEWDANDLGQYLGYLPQEVELFPGTIKDNIARLEPDASPEAVIFAANLAGCHALILQQKKGYDTNIGERGRGISGGQKQRIAFARALFGDPSVVVLDEPNSNLDAEGEKALQEAIIKLKQNQVTVVMIGHRANMMQSMDKLMVIQHHEMVAFGPPQQVLKPLQQKASKQGE